MDISSWLRSNAVTVATLVILAALIFLSSAVFKPRFGNPQLVFDEAPIEKNSELMLSPGETYRYSYNMNGTEINISYAILDGIGCTRVRFVEKLNDSEVCLDSHGNDATGYNSTFSNPSIMLFKPWMLALKEGWTWKSSMFLSYGGDLSPVSVTDYRVIRSESYGNRTAFVVEIKSEDNYSEYQWVDAEKRVLLKSMGQGYEVRRVD
ncbi:MAG TPA: hypothetical protein VLD37_06505 [Candidatus Bilamarchaeum sp.]|nr:hypothetical protein [Candidatus Bilamarchaeum sp.]